jgi:adenylylsulfate reductase subunit A
MGYKTIIEDDIDVLVVGAGLGGTGAAWEARFWGQNKKIVIAEKANINRSGAIWGPVLVKTIQRTMYAMHVST